MIYGDLIALIIVLMVIAFFGIIYSNRKEKKQQFPRYRGYKWDDWWINKH